MSESTVLVPEPQLGGPSTGGDGDWMVIVFNNDTNTFEEVTDILQKATGCGQPEAEMETWEVHHLGRSIVHHADKPECERVAEIIRSIGIQVEVEEL
jgi:ATP-dependent Clp protease adaptor protein ClpS